MLPTCIDSTQLNQSLPGVRPDEFAGESESEAEMDGEPASPTSVNIQGELPQDSTDQDLSEDANYRETVRGVRSFMGWHQIPDYNNTSSSLDDNAFAGSRAMPTGKVSVKLPVDEWLCKKFGKLNVTVAEGYPSRNTETGGLLQDQFVKTPRSSKWYAMHTDKKDSASTTVCDWLPEPAKLNSMFSRVARRSLPSAPASRTFSQDTLRQWERAFWEQSVMCNQAAGLSRCLTKVQDSMVKQLKSLRVDKTKGTQTQQPVETYPGPEHLEHLPKHRVVQNGDPRDNKDLPTARGVGHLHRRILTYTNSQPVQDVHTFSHPASVLPVQSSTLWPVHSTHGVHSGGQRGQTDGFTEGYKNSPVPR